MSTQNPKLNLTTAPVVHINGPGPGSNVQASFQCSGTVSPATDHVFGVVFDSNGNISGSANEGPTGPTIGNVRTWNLPFQNVKCGNGQDLHVETVETPTGSADSSPINVLCGPPVPNPKVQSAKLQILFPPRSFPVCPDFVALGVMSEQHLTIGGFLLKVDNGQVTITPGVPHVLANIWWLVFKNVPVGAGQQLRVRILQGGVEAEQVIDVSECCASLEALNLS